jgi:hypothetical protein
MTEMSKEQHDKVRGLIEKFRDATLQDIEWRSTQQGHAGVSYGDVEKFIAFDTWLKLDDAEQAKKAPLQSPFNHGPGCR